MSNQVDSINYIDRSQLDQLKPYLDQLTEQVETEEYIATDPVQFIHAFDEKEDKLIAGFFAAIMAWGRRDIVIRKVEDFLSRLDFQPRSSILSYSATDRDILRGFKHRTFKPVDMHWMMIIIQRIITRYGSFEQFWEFCYDESNGDNKQFMSNIHTYFFDMAPEAAQRTRKHISRADKKSACKRLWLFLKWTTRPNSPVDQPLMDFLPTSKLMIPLDVHVARHSRALGLLQRKSNDWKAVVNLTRILRYLDPKDPVKYDYALFGLSSNPDFIPNYFVSNPNLQY